MWRWSVDDLDGFWTSVIDYYRIPIRGDWEHVVEPTTMPGARWFAGAKLNYAEALLGGSRPMPRRFSSSRNVSPWRRSPARN